MVGDPDANSQSFLTEAIPWSPHAVLAHRLWFGLDAANRFALLKRWGTAKTAELEFAFLRRHQETYFLDGLRKLGLDGLPHHVASARYHVLSNILGGLDVAYLEEDDRAWTFYLPPSAFGDTGSVRVRHPRRSQRDSLCRFPGLARQQRSLAR